MTEDLKVYTPDQVADLIQVTRLTIYNYLKSGKIKGTKLGGKWLITSKEIERFLGVEEPEKETPIKEDKEKVLFNF